MKYPPYIEELIDSIKKATKQPGEWETIRRALSNYERLIRLDKQGWRFYAIRRTEDGGEIRMVENWEFSKWDLETEKESIILDKIETDIK